LTWTHQTTLSPSDLSLYEGEPEEAKKELDRLRRGAGVRLFGVGGVGSELVEWEWGGLGAGKATGMIKVRLIFSFLFFFREWFSTKADE